MPSHFISINQSVLDINQDGGKSILMQTDATRVLLNSASAQGFQ